MKKNLISLKEAAHILGYQQNTPILALIKSNNLKVKIKKNSNRKWLEKEDVLKLPKLIYGKQENPIDENTSNWVI